MNPKTLAQYAHNWALLMECLSVLFSCHHSLRNCSYTLSIPENLWSLWVFALMVGGAKPNGHRRMRDFIN